MKYFLLLFMPLVAYAQTVAVVGGGPSGLSAATVCQSAGFQTVLFEQESAPCERTLFFWPGEASWKALLKKMRESFTNAGGTVFNRQVTKIFVDKGKFIITTGRSSVQVEAVIVATGKSFSPLSQKTSDRVFINTFHEKPLSPKDSTFIIGQGEPLFRACVQALSTTSHVTIFPYRADDPTVRSLEKSFPFLSIVYAAHIADIGSAKEKAFLTYSQQGSHLRKESSYACIAEEGEPVSSLVKNLCSLDSSLAVVTTHDRGETSLPGLFACGDVTKGEKLTELEAAADGQKVAWGVVHFLVERGFSPKKLAVPPPLVEEITASPDPNASP